MNAWVNVVPVNLRTLLVPGSRSNEQIRRQSGIAALALSVTDKYLFGNLHVAHQSIIVPKLNQVSQVVVRPVDIIATDVQFPVKSSELSIQCQLLFAPLNHLSGSGGAVRISNIICLDVENAPIEPSD